MLAGVAFWTELGGAQPNEPARAPRIRGETFVLARYATSGAVSLYAAAGLGSGAVLAGLAGNRQRGAFTSIVGAGTRVRFGTGISTGVFLAAARTSGDVRTRLYVLPRVATGRAVFSAIAVVAQPVTGGGWQTSVNPATAALRMRPWLQVGGCAVAERIGQRSSRITAGPAAHFHIVRALLSLEALATSPASQPEYRLTVTAR